MITMRITQFSTGYTRGGALIYEIDIGTGFRTGRGTSATSGERKIEKIRDYWVSGRILAQNYGGIQWVRMYWSFGESPRMRAVPL